LATALQPQDFREIPPMGLTAPAQKIVYRPIHRAGNPRNGPFAKIGMPQFSLEPIWADAARDTNGSNRAQV